MKKLCKNLIIPHVNVHISYPKYFLITCKAFTHTHTHGRTDGVISARDDPGVTWCPPTEPVLAVGGVDCWAVVIDDAALFEAGF